MEFLFAPSIIFLVIVAPIWITAHYRYKSKMTEGISEKELADIEDMLETVDRLVERVDTLEEILNAERPTWRNDMRRDTR